MDWLPEGFAAVVLIALLLLAIPQCSVSVRIQMDGAPTMTEEG